MIIITFNNWCLVNIFEMQCESSCTASSWLVFQWNTNRPFFPHASHLCSILNRFTAGTTKEMKMFSGHRVGQALCMAVSSCDSDEALLQFSDLAGNSMCFVKRKKELRPHPFSWLLSFRWRIIVCAFKCTALYLRENLHWLEERVST